MANAPFHGIHELHAFEGFEIEGDTIVARCECGAVLDTARAVFRPCPDCVAGETCTRCGGTGSVVDHARLEWSLSKPS